MHLCGSLLERRRCNTSIIVIMLCTFAPGFVRNLRNSGQFSAITSTTGSNVVSSSFNPLASTMSGSNPDVSLTSSVSTPSYRSTYRSKYLLEKEEEAKRRAAEDEAKRKAAEDAQRLADEEAKKLLANDDKKEGTTIISTNSCSLHYNFLFIFIFNTIFVYVPRKPRRDPSNNHRLYEHGICYLSDTARTRNLFRHKLSL